MKVLYRLGRLRWYGDMYSLVFLTTVISLWSVVSAGQTSRMSECDQLCHKTRELVTTLWGGVFTLLVFCFDSWGLMVDEPEKDDMLSGITIQRVSSFIGLMLNPMEGICQLVENAVNIYHISLRMLSFTVCSSFFPWTKNSAKILCGCAVVITFPAIISIPSDYEEDMPYLSEALVIGCGREDSVDTKNVRLNYEGKGVLLGMNVLPAYDQLKALQGNSGLATIISAVQSMGYIYGVVVRTIQGLPLSPIEVLAGTLSFVILIKALLHNVVSPCHRPLHVYLTHDEALTFADMYPKYKLHDIPTTYEAGPAVVVLLLVSSVLIYYMLHMWQTRRIIMVLPILLNLVGFNVRVIGLYSSYEIVDICSELLGGMINTSAYVLALVGTIKYWEVERLNAKTSSILAQMFPYIG